MSALPDSPRSLYNRTVRDTRQRLLRDLCNFSVGFGRPIWEKQLGHWMPVDDRGRVRSWWQQAPWVERKYV